jgi:hypothetical protein
MLTRVLVAKVSANSGNASFWHANGVTLVVGVVTLVLGGLIAALVSRHYRTRKTLDWVMLGDVPIMPMRDKLAQLEVRYRDVVLTQPRLVTIRLINTGNVEIRPEDYSSGRNVTFLAKSGRIVVAVGIDLKGPSKCVINPHDGAWELGPELLNPSDSIDVQFVLDGSPEDALSVSARVAGASRGVTQIKQPVRWGWGGGVAAHWVEYILLLLLVATIAGWVGGR